MQKLRKLYAMGLAALPDFCAGACLVEFISAAFHRDIRWFDYAIGAVLGVAPDFDLFWMPVRSKKEEYFTHHECLPHRPIIGVPAAFVIGWFCGGLPWAAIASACLFWHYVHDTKGFMGVPENGLAWFWPFSRRYWGIQNWRVISTTLDEHIRFGFKEPLDVEYLRFSYRVFTEMFVASVALGTIGWHQFGSRGVYAGLTPWVLFFGGIVVFGRNKKP